ncbi:DNA-binding protein [Arthrobacter sp. RIT-PI-e]|uniref:integration host factor, actinobacterial type n=1 Tax=Arthrobacter sp. RIT-PI-e TaxID=1681197 RepID=UPI00067647D0|nr:integration host factor, actinobacterial type [Arthrobacter sp. RIT-PI-e]KNC19076.1 DNA-binding protein [Arthrobacter sp. RIT-PI-e]
MSLKPLTDAERARARTKATAARAVRADLKARLKTGKLSGAEVIENSAGDDAVGRLKVLDLLKALPGVGEARAAGIMTAVGIAATRRVRGLGIHQRKALIRHLEDHHAGPASE